MSKISGIRMLACMEGFRNEAVWEGWGTSCGTLLVGHLCKNMDREVVKYVFV